MRTGEVTTVHQGDPPFLRFFGMSNDGTRVLFAIGESNVVWVADTRTGQRWQVPLQQNERISAGALSGNGRFAFLATNRGRIARYAVGTTQSRDIVPPTPYVTLPHALAPGSFTELAGSPDFDVEMLRDRIRAGDRPLHVLYVEGSKIGVQPQWDLGGEQAVRLDVPSASPLQQHELVWVYWNAEPMWDRDAGGYMGLKLVREDFSGMQTELPKPGEIVHLYLTGLGRVDGFSEVGVPTPSDRLFPIKGEFRCRFQSYGDYAETLFAGLAPGMIGIYQVTMRMPATQQTPTGAAMSLECTGDYGSFGITGARLP